MSHNYFTKKNISICIFMFLYAYSPFTYAEVAPENILLEKCMFSYTKTYKYLKKNKAFAYARVDIGEEDYCVWTQGEHSVENARNIALKACEGKVVDARCKIVDVNDAWLGNKDDFSIVMPADNTPLLPQEMTSLMHEAKKFVFGACLSLFENHLQDKGHKVFAYSIDEEGNYACATSKEHQTLRKAALMAMQACEDKKVLLQNMAPQSPCLSFSDGKNILVKAKDFNITLDVKSNTFVTQKVYKHHVDKAKDTLFGPCLMQYKYYLRNKDHKAFYIAKDRQNNLVCGLSFDRFTIRSAKKHALKKCEDAAKRKKVSAACTLFSLNLHESF